MEKVKQIPAYTSTRTIHLVWFITLLGCLTGLLMAVLVWWAIVDIKDVRQVHFVLKGKVNTVLSSFGQGIAENKLFFHQLLKDEVAFSGGFEERITDGANLRLILDSLESVVGDPGENFHYVQDKVRTFLALEDECRDWLRRYRSNDKDLAESRKEVVAAIQKIHEAIDKVYGRQRLAKAIRLRNFGQSSGADESALARQIVYDERQADASMLLREVSDLALLVERLRGERRLDFFNNIKDNLLRTSLVRLRRSILLLPDAIQPDSKEISKILDELEETLFGQGYVMDSNHQTVEQGRGGYFNASVARLNLQIEKDRLRREIDERAAALDAALQSVEGLVEAKIDHEGRKVENTLKRTGRVLVLIILITGALFVFASSRIIKAIKNQVRAIEDANLVLDSRTKALVLSQQEINESKIRLQSLSSNLLNAQENERKRIARELHDELGASMAVLKMQVRSAEKSLGLQIPEQLHDECEKLRASINQIIENVRRLSRDLSPVVLEDLGLAAAIEHLIDNFAELNKLTIKSDLADIHFLVKEEAQRNVYRILQELLNNVRKHAAAKNVIITVRKVEAGLKFLVADDGVGLDVDEVHRNSTKASMGLTTIAERVRILGGTITIDSRPGQGCRVEFTAPIKRRDAELSENK